ncbi:MAG: hypothetical protein ABIH99_02405 [Candidatus Micrarchaeota archaeon]
MHIKTFLIALMLVCSFCLAETTLETGLINPPISEVSEHNEQLSAVTSVPLSTAPAGVTTRTPDFSDPFSFFFIKVLTASPSVNDSIDGADENTKILWTWGESHGSGPFTSSISSSGDCGGSIQITRQTAGAPVIQEFRADLTLTHYKKGDGKTEKLEENFTVNVPLASSGAPVESTRASNPFSLPSSLHGSCDSACPIFRDLMHPYGETWYCDENCDNAPLKRAFPRKMGNIIIRDTSEGYSTPIAPTYASGSTTSTFTDTYEDDEGYEHTVHIHVTNPNPAQATSAGSILQPAAEEPYSIPDNGVQQAQLVVTISGRIALPMKDTLSYSVKHCNGDGNGGFNCYCSSESREFTYNLLKGGRSASKIFTVRGGGTTVLQMNLAEKQAGEDTTYPGYIYADKNRSSVMFVEFTNKNIYKTITLLDGKLLNASYAGFFEVVEGEFGVQYVRFWDAQSVSEIKEDDELLAQYTHAQNTNTIFERVNRAAYVISNGTGMNTTYNETHFINGMVNNMSVGTHTLRVITCDMFGNQHEFNQLLLVRAQSNLTMDMSPPLEPGSEAKVNLLLTDYAGNPLSGEKITLKSGKQSANVYTNAEGKATYSFLIDSPGMHSVSADYAGDYTQASAASQSSFNIHGTATGVDLSGGNLAWAVILSVLVGSLFLQTGNVFGLSAVSNAAQYGIGLMSLARGAAGSMGGGSSMNLNLGKFGKKGGKGAGGAGAAGTGAKGAAKGGMFMLAAGKRKKEEEKKKYGAGVSKKKTESLSALKSKAAKLKEKERMAKAGMEKQRMGLNNEDKRKRVVLAGIDEEEQKKQKQSSGTVLPKKERLDNLAKMEEVEQKRLMQLSKGRLKLVSLNNFDEKTKTKFEFERTRLIAERKKFANANPNVQKKAEQVLEHLKEDGAKKLFPHLSSKIDRISVHVLSDEAFDNIAGSDTIATAKRGSITVIYRDGSQVFNEMYVRESRFSTDKYGEVKPHNQLMEDMGHEMGHCLGAFRNESEPNDAKWLADEGFAEAIAYRIVKQAEGRAAVSASEDLALRARIAERLNWLAGEEKTFSSFTHSEGNDFSEKFNMFLDKTGSVEAKNAIRSFKLDGTAPNQMERIESQLKAAQETKAGDNPAMKEKLEEFEQDLNKRIPVIKEQDIEKEVTRMLWQGRKW